MTYNNPNAEFSEDLLGLYIDGAIDELYAWRKLSNDAEFLDGRYDSVIQEFVVESLNVNGNEGKASESSSGMTSNYYGDPIANLRSRVSQRLG